MKNVYKTKSWADVCGGDVVSNSFIIHVRELKECERQSTNIVIHEIKEENMEAHTFFEKVISEFLHMHYSMSNVNVYGVHQANKHGIACSEERPIVYTMKNDKKWRIMQCFTSKDRTISQQKCLS